MNKELENQLIEQSQLFSFSEGLLVLPPNTLPNASTLLKPNLTSAQANDIALATPAPTTLYPTPLPLHLFEYAQSIQPIFNQLVDNISNDKTFLLEHLKPLIEVDPFLRELITIFEKVNQQDEEEKQMLKLGIHRSDYLLHYDGEVNEMDGDVQKVVKFLTEDKDKFHLFQVELNTIASSFGALSTKTTDLHKHLARFSNDYQHLYPDAQLRIPENNTLDSIVDGLALAHRSYSGENTAILMVVQPDERNIFDQRHIELLLMKKYSIPLVRQTFSELKDSAMYDSQNRLTIGKHEISVIYYRSGYSPDDYLDSSHFEVRLKLELSYAIKCPNIAYQLVGSKKIQQILTQDNILERFLTQGSADLIKRSFTGLYPLDDSISGKKAYEEALSNPTKYVLKPSREGGGNNIYTTDIPEFLKSLSPEQRQAYILMELIQPPKFKNNNLGLRFGNPKLKGNFISELGIFGVYLKHEEDGEIVNFTGGHLLRSKLDSSNEGGVAVGHSVIDSPYLV